MCENIALSSMLAALEITINMILKENCYCAFRKQHARDVIKILACFSAVHAPWKKRKRLRKPKTSMKATNRAPKRMWFREEITKSHGN